MRWEPSKMGMKGARRRTLRGPRRESARNSMLRRITLEALESRTLLDATLPTPTVVANSQIEYLERRRATTAVRRLPSTSTTRTSWRRSGYATIPSWRRGSRSSWRWRSPTTPGLHGRSPRRYRSSPNPNTSGPTVPLRAGDRPECRVRPQRPHLRAHRPAHDATTASVRWCWTRTTSPVITPVSLVSGKRGVRVGRHRPCADADDGSRRPTSPRSATSIRSGRP